MADYTWPTGSWSTNNVAVGGGEAWDVKHTEADSARSTHDEHPAEWRTLGYIYVYVYIFQLQKHRFRFRNPESHERLNQSVLEHQTKLMRHASIGQC